MAAGPEPVKGSVVAEEEPLETVSASSQSEFTLTDQTQGLKLRLTFSGRIKLRLKSPWQLKPFRQSYARDGLPKNSGCEGYESYATSQYWWPIVQVSHNWAAINFGNFKGEVSCDKTVASPHWTLASAIKTGAILCFAVSHCRQPFDGVLTGQWVNWKANEKTLCAFSIIGAHQKTLIWCNPDPPKGKLFGEVWILLIVILSDRLRLRLQ